MAPFAGKKIFTVRQAMIPRLNDDNNHGDLLIKGGGMVKFEKRILVYILLLAALTAVFYYWENKNKQQQLKSIATGLQCAEQRELRLRNALQLTRRVLDSKQEKVVALEKELHDEILRTASFRIMLVDLRSEYTRIKKGMAELRIANEMMADKVKQMLEKKTISLEKIVINREKIPQGRIVSVNKYFDFVIIDLGEQDGLKAGEVLGIFKGRDAVGEVQIEKLYEEISAAAILPNSQKDRLEAGDMVKAL
ncbi:MAG: hypothetical protein ABH952_09345 [Candidatus Omnitrophota bacterium]